MREKFLVAAGSLRVARLWAQQMGWNDWDWMYISEAHKLQGYYNRVLYYVDEYDTWDRWRQFEFDCMISDRGEALEVRYVYLKKFDELNAQ